MINQTIYTIAKRYKNRGTILTNTHFPENNDVKGNEDTTTIVFAEKILIASKIKSGEKDHWIKDYDWRDVVLDLKDLAYHFSFVNDIAVKDWGGNLENIVEDFLMEYNPE